MTEGRITTYIVDGFLGVGKTPYLQDCILRGFFHKRGKTLILSFEEGETEYDAGALAAFRTEIAYYEGGESISAFCLREIEQHAPDRIYVEGNAMLGGFPDELPKIMRVVDTTTLIDGQTLALYFNNMRQLMQKMITASNTVIFLNCADKKLLEPYDTPMRIMNSKCVYLWESPMGYSEQAFGLYLPYDLTLPELVITDDIFPVWYLDTLKDPEHYAGKTLELTAQADCRTGLPEGTFIVGRMVMTCCLADIQFLGCLCRYDGGMRISDRDWLHIIAKGELTEDRYREKKLVLVPTLLEKGKASPDVVLGAAK